MAFQHRVREPEILDQPDVSPEEVYAGLEGLDRMHWWSQTVSLLWQPIARLVKPGDPPLRILDIACGSGASLVELGRRACKAGIDVELAGCDINPMTIAYAESRAKRAGMPATFFRFDAAHDPLPEGFDVVFTSTFLHHLSDEQAISLMARMRQSARRLVLIDDLIRGWWGAFIVFLGTRGLFTARVNQIDGDRHAPPQRASTPPLQVSVCV